MKRFIGAVVAASALFAQGTVQPALAQKSADTVRVPLNEPVQQISPYFTSHPGNYFFMDSTYESLIEFDPRTGKIDPVLAKSYTRVDPQTLDFDLRDDILFHNGKKFDADDVVSMISWLRDPATKLRHMEDTDFIDRAEKLGPYKVRLHMVEPTGVDLAQLTYAVRIYDSSIHAKLADKSEYDRNIMVGTGPYKIIQREANKGTIAVKNEGYKTLARKTGKVGRIHGLTVPDEQTRIANFLTGNVELVGDLTVDQIADLRKNPKFRFTASPGMPIYYLQMDALGKSGRKELTDPRVRKAIFMAIDRDALIKVLMPAPEIAKAPDVFCHENRMIGCAHTKSYPKYDPDGAKKLLAEAGYPNGFELIVDSVPPETKAVGEAIAGQLYKVGIKARHVPLATPAYRDWQRDGKLEAHLAPWTMTPDVTRSLNRFFTLGGQTDMFGDKILADLRVAGNKETDPDKRQAIYAQLYDRVIDESLILPITTVPNVFIHSAELKIDPGSINQWGTDLWDFSWN